jgi:hypothetical protein
MIEEDFSGGEVLQALPAFIHKQFLSSFPEPLAGVEPAKPDYKTGPLPLRI